MKEESFKELMGCELDQSEDWDNCERLYANYIKGVLNIDQKIPKKIHQIWIGDVPNYVFELSEKIKNLHPSWEYKLWTSNDIESYNLKNRRLYDAIDNLGGKSDIARYEILFNEGGIYMDTDFDMVKSFDELTNVDFFIGTGEVSQPEVFNGLMGCCKNNTILKNVIDELHKISDAELSNGCDVMSTTGPYFFSKIFFDYIKNNPDASVVCLPSPYFYPFSRHNRWNVRGKHLEMSEYVHAFDTKHTICTHLWYNSWQ